MTQETVPPSPPIPPVPPPAAAPQPYPVDITIPYPERLSRGKLLLKVFLWWIYLLPHVVILYVLDVIVAVVTFFAFFAILFTGKYPRGMFDFTVGVLRWSTRVTAFLGLMRDEYPPFRMAR